MEIRQIRYALAVAAELHFGAAANRLGVSQPAVSEQIRLLEADLGVQLFDRTSRSVQITPVGAVFLEDARRMLADIDRTRLRVAEHGRGERGRLRIGAVGPALTWTVPMVVKEVVRLAPQLDISLTAMSTESQIRAILDGDLDVGFIRVISRRKGLRVEHLLDEPLTAALPTEHRLATAASIKLSELNGEPFVVWPRTFNPSFFDEVIATCHRHGCLPSKLIEGSDMQTQLASISAGLGVSVLPRSFMGARRDQVAFVPLREKLRPVPLQLVWSAAHEEPAVRRLHEVATRLRPVLAAKYVVPDPGT
jgi:DNA-binding transcriptional LysR family regulator